MLLAIDVGNTHSVYGFWDGSTWRTYRRATNSADTEDEIAAWLIALTGSRPEAHAIICASVVPSLNDAIKRLGREVIGTAVTFLHSGADVGLPVDYDPPSAVGADRLANALGALDEYKPPLVVVDFGTATTFDVVNAEGVYIGGAILTGVDVSTQALISRTAKLPQFEFRAPERAIGRSTVESLQAGIVLGYAGAIESLARRIKAEMGGSATVIATGGLGALFLGLVPSLEAYEENLTLNGLRIAAARLSLIP